MGILNKAQKGPAIVNHLEPRARVELRLSGGVDGAIPLDDLAKVAGHAQELVRKLGRAVAGKGGPGRPPSYLERVTDLVAVGIREGSAVLEIEAPAWASELDLPGEVESDSGLQALELVSSALEAVAAGHPLPEPYTEPIRNELRAIIEATASYEALEWTLKHHGGSRTASLRPAAVTVPQLLSAPPTPPERGTVEGELYALNSKTGTYTLEDITGHAINCHVDPGSSIAARLDHLVRNTVALSGEITRDTGGRITGLQVEHVETRDLPGGGAFWSFNADEALSTALPIASVADLAIDGLSDAEGTEFRRALGFE